VRRFRKGQLRGRRAAASLERMPRTALPLVLLALAALLVVVVLRGHRSSGPPAGVVRASWTLTPGVVNPDVTQATIRQTICRRGWTKTIRPPSSYTDALKRKGLVQYGLRGPPSAYQEDHLISLELGGNPTDPRNLWPEPYPRAAAVDKIENQLNEAVCSGRLTLAQAQREESGLKHRDG
jgi:hypothetical protein